MPRLLLGAMNSTPAMMTTPITCHHTLMSPITFTRSMRNVLSRPCTTSTMRKMMKIFPTVSLKPSSNMRMK